MHLYPYYEKKLQKRFVKLLLDEIIMSLLYNNELWGYKILIFLIYEDWGILLNPSFLYATLHRLESEEIIYKVKDDNRKCFYGLTEKGAELSVFMVDGLSELLQRIKVKRRGRLVCIHST